MREMKDSGVEWIGEVPSTWRVMPLKALFSFGKGLPITKENLEEAGVPVISYGQIHAKWNSGVTTHDNLLRYVNRSYLESNPQSLVQMGDFIMADTSEDREGCGNCAYIDVKDVLFAGYHTIILRSNYNADNKYLAYLFLTDSWRSQIRKSVSGVKLFSISRRILGTVSVLLPDNTKPIVHYLDSKCSQIDTLIQNVQTQIEKLKAYKQSLITEVVTKGLAPTVPMKDSGVEWLGKYPSHWAYMPFGYVLKERAEKNNPVVTQERLSLSIELGVTLYAEKTTNLDRFKDDFSQYKLAHAGDLVMNSMNMIVGATGVSAYFGCVSPAYYTFYDETDEHITAKFCEYVFRSKTMLRVLHSMGKGIYSIERGDDRINTCRLKVPKVDLKSLHIAIPPLKEQRSIVLHLNEKSNQIDRLISIKQAKIEKLEQYKRSLIYEYVTGKKEVRL